MLESNQWLKKAQQDFNTAIYNIQGNKIEAGVFFLQQAAEKAFKSVLIKRTRKISRTHDLVVLARAVKAPKELLEFSKELSPAYLYTRYPDVTPEKNLKSKIPEFISHTRKILKWAKENI
tara:strand:+ start:26360 stop:26719 length:360 start_codon:yes stop_codon:yes gene_type:complete